MAASRYAAGAVDVGRLSRTVLQLVGGVAVLAAWRWMPGPGRGGPWPMVVIGAAMVGWFLLQAVRDRRDLRALLVDERGVRLGRAVVAWPYVREVVVLRHGPQGTGGDAAPEVGVVLRADRGLPPGLTALVREPDPDAVPAQLRLSTAGFRLDVDRLGAAVRAHGDVPLVERWGGARRVLA